MSSVQFLHFPSSIQHQIVRKMNLRELVKFSFCSKRINRAVKSAEIPLDILEGQLEDGRLEMRMKNSSDEYTISINPHYLNAENDRGPEYTGFGGLRMYDYAYFHLGNVFPTGIVALPEGQNFLETSDRVMGHLRSLFEDVSSSNWLLCPTNSQSRVILKKHFPKMTSLGVYSLPPRDQVEKRQRITKEDVHFFLEQLEVTDSFDVLAEAEEGVQYSEGFQADRIRLSYPSWMHWDAILNSTSQSIDLYRVRTLSSSDLNRFLKLWMSKKKIQALTRFSVRLECQEFPPDFLELVLEGIRNYDVGLKRWREIDEVDPGQSMQRIIRRVDGKMATVRVTENAFHFRAY